MNTIRVLEDSLYNVINGYVNEIIRNAKMNGITGNALRTEILPELYNRIRVFYGKEKLEKEQAAVSAACLLDRLAEHDQMEMEKNDAESVLTVLIWRCGILASLIKGRALGGMNEKTENFEHLTRLVLLLTTDENSRYRVPEKTVFDKTQIYFASAAEGDEEKAAIDVFDKMLEKALEDETAFRSDKGKALRAYSHPIDSGIISVLDRPVVNSVFNKYVNFMVDRVYGQVLASAIPVTSNNYPNLNAIVDECVGILHIHRPYVVVSQSVPGLNAVTFGNDEKPYIAISALMVRLMDDEKMRFIIGHECGHIAMGHVIYHTVVDTIRLFGYSIPAVGDLVYKAVEYPLHAWHRRSEITADRAGLLCCRSLENAQKTLLQLESGFTDVEKIDLGEYLKNSREFLKGSWVRRVGELKSTHPLTPKRILALALFAHSRLYHDLCADEIGKKDDTAGLLDENMLASETEAILKVV